MKKVAIAGASGFIGTNLCARLLQDSDCQVVALSRSERVSDHPRLTWAQCDLFSLKDITEALEDVHTVYYLVHSMLPSAALSQGTFYDFDLIMADNFIRAARACGVQHIIYLGGMIPERAELSWHLKSRLEVEVTLKCAPSPPIVTCLRAGLVMGPGGSSFLILQRLIERLPILICPSWTETRSQPVDLEDMLRVLLRVNVDQALWGKIYDIGGPEIVTYKGLMQTAARLIKRDRAFLTLEIIPLKISRMWVSLITSVPRDLVYPLVLSLKHEMIASPEHSYPYAKYDISITLEDSLKRAMDYHKAGSLHGHRAAERDVRSIQRFELPTGANAQWVAQEYFRWLPKVFPLGLRTVVDGNKAIFFLLHPRMCLLKLELSSERSSPDRQLLYITGGLLAGNMRRGRLEFREVLNRRYIMAAIHEFRPALPWYIYRWSQAIVHLWVMKGFARHLKRAKPYS
jgi:uncharacterized protein YbjT (DUF2867 family)